MMGQRRCAVRLLGILLPACSHPAHGVTAEVDVSTYPVAAAIPTSRAAASVAEEPPTVQRCTEPGDVTWFTSPERPVGGQPLRVVALVDRPVDARLTVSLLPEAKAVEVLEPQGGPPFFWLARIAAPGVGTWRATLRFSPECGAASLAVKEGRVSATAVAPLGVPRTSLWGTRRAWSPSMEDIYSAWVQQLFDAPIDTQPTFAALHDVLRDPRRNFLFDHLGMHEDQQGTTVRPDCADLPYFLRAYFAFKLGLSFGWSHCSRGENGAPPRCSDFATNEDPFPPSNDPPVTLPSWADPERDRSGPWENNMKRLGEFFRTTLADAVQSGAGRTPADAEESDFYPVTVSVDSLRPGTIFADPYGHVLVIASRIPQAASASGVLLAVDGQPDGTVSRKRFWRGNFLFAIDAALGSAGFKRFRPIVRDPVTGRLVHGKNADIADYSPTDQYSAGVEGFYDKIEDLLSPAALSPTQALAETIQALEEQVKTRVTSVDNGRKFLASGRSVADMPDGERIFETTGSWEDFATPSRDLRLLIAIDVARALPGRIERRIEHYAVPEKSRADRVREDLERRVALELRERRFQYQRSDGSEWELSLEDVVERQIALEMAYNPNDCVEQRWGALPGTPEAATCTAHAPAAQRDKMAEYRIWFHDRRRPPR
ncbi:MAG: hypothetical protein ABSF69_12715 [Polyangiaceae bacterium]|jgi:hypothetical protein